MFRPGIETVGQIHPDRLKNIQGNRPKSSPDLDKGKQVNVVHRLNSVTDYSRDLLCSNATIDGEPLTVTFDSGAAITCLSYDFFQKLSPETRKSVKSQSVERELCAATGGAMPVIGEVSLDMSFEGPSGIVNIEEVLMVIVKNLNSQCLIGGNILGDNRFSGYHVDFPSNTITFSLPDGDKTSIYLSNKYLGESKLTGKFPVWTLRDITIPARCARSVFEERRVSEEKIILFS